jgi:hypothetical protein
VTTTDKMHKNAKTYHERIEEIRRDWTRSDEAKRVDLEAAYSEASSAHKALEDEFRAEVRDRLTEARKAAFSVPRMGKDASVDLLSYRDALDRAGRLRDARELSDLLARAEITGDDALARAVLYRGYELQSEGLVRSYLERYPDHAPAWQEFCEAAEESNTLETLGISAAAGVSEPERPQELGRAFSAPTT